MISYNNSHVGDAGSSGMFEDTKIMINQSRIEEEQTMQYIKQNKNTNNVPEN